MHWFLLLLAGLLEIAWAIGLKYSDGLSRPLPSGLTLLALIASLTLLSLAMKQIPLGSAYAIWSGIGAIGSVIAGIWLFGDQLSAGRLISLLAIIGGIAGLKLSS